jgi:putative DNA primase/helicase
MLQTFSERTKGRWHGILPQLGISPKMLRNRHGPCPMCGGKDRFRFDDKDGKGTWICNQCGSGDGAQLVQQFKRVRFKEAAKMIEGVAGKVGVRQSWAPKSSTRDELNMLWKRAQPITPTSTVGRYLMHRCGVIPPPGVMRENGNEMLAVVSGHNTDDRNGITLHRTMIGFGNEVQWRRLMPGKLPDNVAIRLSGFRDDSFLGAGLGTLGIAEGIETALSASVLFNVPVWAAISAPLLKKWRPPESVQKVIIFGDNDENYTGQEAAYSLAKVLKNDVEVEVKIPSIPGWDWNDVQRNNNGNS